MEFSTCMDSVDGWKESVRDVGAEVLKNFQGRTAQRNGRLVSVARLSVQNQNSCLLPIN